MNSFHNIIQKFLMSTVVAIFVFVTVYVPQPLFKVNEADAAAVYGDVVTQGTTGATVGTTGMTAASTGASASSNASLVAKEYTLDALLFAMAKQMLKSMTTSIVNWINNGFEGSPAFVQDLDGFLLNAADETLGMFLEDMETLNFLCDPFRLDVRIALATVQNQTRDNNAKSCTLSGALENIESFMDGNFEDGGWDAWLSITTEPETYTAYGQYLTAERLAEAKMAEAKNNEKAQLSFGEGFLSSKVCENTGDGTRENCVISTPGKVIEEALTFQLSTGAEVLIAADEIDEIVGALMGQLATKAITGAAGLLGLSEGTGYTEEGYESGSYLGDLELESAIDMGEFRDKVESGLAIEQRYYDAAVDAYPRLLQFASSSNASQIRKEYALDEANQIVILAPILQRNIATLQSILTRLDGLPEPSQDTDATRAVRRDLILEYSKLSLHSDAIVNAHILNWQRYIRDIPPDEEAEERANGLENTLNNIEGNTSESANNSSNGGG